MITLVDVDGYEWLPCLDGTYVAVAEDGYHTEPSREFLEIWYGPLTEVAKP